MIFGRLCKGLIFRGSIQSLYPLSIQLRTPVTGLARGFHYRPASLGFSRVGFPRYSKGTHWAAVTNFIPIHVESQGLGFTLARAASC